MALKVEFAINYYSWFCSFLIFLSKMYVLDTLPAEKSSFRVKKMLLFDMLHFIDGDQLFFSKIKFWTKSFKNIFFQWKKSTKTIFFISFICHWTSDERSRLKSEFIGIYCILGMKSAKCWKKCPKKATVFPVTSSAFSYETIIFPCRTNLDLYRKIIILTTGVIV